MNRRNRGQLCLCWLLMKTQSSDFLWTMRQLWMTKESVHRKSIQILNALNNQSSANKNWQASKKKPMPYFELFDSFLLTKESSEKTLGKYLLRSFTLLLTIPLKFTVHLKHSAYAENNDTVMCTQPARPATGDAWLFSLRYMILFVK